jgi:hypothetical protein
MRTELSPAVDSLRNQLREQMAEVSETKKMINALLRRMGEDPEFEDVEIGQQLPLRGTTRPDLYYGKPFATAAQEYLEHRKQACSADEIMTALEHGGFDFKKLAWKDRKNWPRLTAISLAKNNQKFHKLPNGTFGLLSWYPDVAKRNENVIQPVKKKRGRPPKIRPAADQVSKEETA